MPLVIRCIAKRPEVPQEMHHDQSAGLYHCSVALSMPSEKLLLHADSAQGMRSTTNSANGVRCNSRQLAQAYTALGRAADAYMESADKLEERLDALEAFDADALEAFDASA
jgi:hypothetical protein